MRFYEISKPKSPLTPQQAKLSALKRNAEVAKNAVDAERKAQQIAKAQQRIQKLSKNNSTI
jgi:hypothetical protein